ncbi:MAG: bifunctional enoyl-CoA hydratase/phosphate acetyltransferase [Lentisphaerae bacterium]|jgi:phosphate butyryltransferase|nr:bifunctional enoyl-CoA hydratase/phosphate acetyltransferase [Lentisphaerota bacterium]MBT4818906.1 bifunctional enoyl-CoA hydratase/phosphate acetyltransferase [Lentisphaerota bacterium]MBT5606103.1 bifunctional enoyl-CoA hydratase/phosphate acetyltransferase [Lentisphaerota bacterium]MBT7058551.1 bifunctional enoyl-CoA hydratase/phosphate acetyltransferase [Lentisphaerota bacterium]MBT7845785.1 bifunctional enoyl-CoA hydratase/phosphate acetyltransferase [Lentisphaerota bacterium]
MTNFDEILTAVRAQPVRRIAVAAASDAYVIEAASEAKRQNIAESILVGDEGKIRQAADSVNVSLDAVEIVHQPEPIQACAEAAKLVSGGKADILMKGYVHTDDFLRAVLDREFGLRTGSIMSHVFVAEMRVWDRLIFISDSAMNIAPDLEQKSAILLNAVYLAKLFGVEQPKVAALAAVELVNPAMPATLDAAALGTMADRNQYVPGATVDGPFALDNAVCPAAAKHKRISGPVAGQADILIVPNIEAGNMLAKALVYFGGHRLIGLLVGAKAPVVLTSRADTMESKMLSMAGAVLMVNRKRATRLKVGKVHF